MLLIPKFFQEMLCVLLLYPMTLRLRQGKTGRFIAAIACWSLVAFINNLLTVLNLNAWGEIDLSRPLLLLGLALFIFLGAPTVYGGAPKLLILILAEDFLLGSLTYFSGVIIAVLTRNTPQYVMQHEEIIYHPGSLLLNFVLFLATAWILKPLLRWFRDSSFEQAFAVKVCSYLIPLLMVSPMTFKKNIYGIFQEEFVIQSLLANVIQGAAVAFFACYCYYALVRHDNRMLQMEIQYLHEKMEGLREQVMWTRKLRHDIRRHINVLRWTEVEPLTSQQEEQRNAYRKQLEEFYDQLSLGDYCNNPDVNAAISQLERNCRRQGIPLEVQLKNADFSSMEQPLEVFSRIVFWAEQCISNLNQASAEISVHAGKTAGVNRLLFRIHFKEGNKHFKRMDALDNACLEDLKKTTIGQVQGEIENEAEDKKLNLQW